MKFICSLTTWDYFTNMINFYLNPHWCKIVSMELLKASFDSFEKNPYTLQLMSERCVFHIQLGRDSKIDSQLIKKTCFCSFCPMQAGPDFKQACC